MRSICGSDGIALHFPDDELHQEYKNREELLNIETYAKIRKKYGIWAGNQNKFVKSREDLNNLDGRYMEDLYDQYSES